MPTTILSSRVETFRDFYNTTEPIIGDGSRASEMDIKLVQYLLRCWSMSGGGAATVLRKEAARVASKPGFICGQFNPATRRVLQLFETDFELLGDGIVLPVPSYRGSIDPFQMFRQKLGLLNCLFQAEIQRRMGNRPFAEIRARIVGTMPVDLARTLYPNVPRPPSESMEDPIQSAFDPVRTQRRQRG
jgi:hypothetical protein